jgi:integral membrane protein
MTGQGNNKISRLRVVSAVEGISFIVLVFVAVPLKYIWHQPWLVQNMGMVHGLAFILYVFSIIQYKVELGWDTGKTALALLLSIVPFGTFYVAARMLPQMNTNEAKPE